MIYSRRITKSLLAIGLTMVFANFVNAKLATKNVEQNEINGYYPFMRSVSAELLTDALDDKGQRVDYPWVLQDDNVTKGPTIGSIAYVPDIFCSIDPSELEAALTDPILGSYAKAFDFLDLDKDPCNPEIGKGVSIKWYMLDDVKPWNENLKWEDLNPVEIPAEYIIKAGSDVAKKYQKKHSYSPLISKAITLNTLDAVEIPTAALGKRIGFVLEPKSQFGLPTIGKPVKVWDLYKYFGQNPPSEPGSIDEDTDSNPGFILGNNPELNIDGSSSTAGGVVQLGRPPYVRSIGAQYDITDTITQDGTQRFFFDIYSFGATAEDTIETGEYTPGDVLIGTLGNGGGYVYIPDVFCQYKNNDYSDAASLEKLMGELKFPVFNMFGGNKDAPKKFRLFRPLFWMADADDDSCDITSDQIEWFLVEPKDSRLAALKVSVADYRNKYDGKPTTPESTEAARDLVRQSAKIWFDVESWDDISIIQKLDSIPKNQNVSVTVGTQNLDVEFARVGKKFISATKVPFDKDNKYIRQVAFVYTPKTRSGNPDTGRQIKVPVALGRVWGQLPSSRPANLEQAKGDSEFIQTQNASGSGIRIGVYPQTLDRNSSTGKLDLISWSSLSNMNYVKMDCLFDLSKIPARDCVSEMPPVRKFLSPQVPSSINDMINVEKSARRSVSTLAENDAAGRIESYKLEGFFGVGEEITVKYDFRSAVINFPLEGLNRTVYQIGEINEVKASMDDAYEQAGDNLTQGINTFKLPRLTAEQVALGPENLVIGLRPYNGRGVYEKDIFINFTSIEAVSPPRIENLKITSASTAPLPGDTLKGTYDFIKAVGTKVGTDASTFSWTGANAVNNKPVTISGQVDDYIVQNEDAGATIVLTVNGADSVGNDGNTLTAKQLIDSPKPKASNIQFVLSNQQLTPTYSATLTASYDFDSGIVGNTIDKSTYHFSIGDVIKASQTKQYQVTAADVGKAIAFSVTPVNSQDTEGETIQESYTVEPTSPSVQNVKIIVKEERESPYGGVLSASYDFLPGITQDPSDASTLNWTGSSQSSQTSDLQFSEADIGKVVTLKVTPIDGVGQIGEPGYATYDFVTAPQIVNLNIAQDILSLQPPYAVRLTATYNFVKGTSKKPDDNSTYQWTGLTTPVSGTVVAGKVPLLNVTAVDAGKLITLTMLPKDNSDIKGKAVIATSLMPTQKVPPKIEQLRLVNTNAAREDNFYVNDIVRADYVFTGSTDNNVDASRYTWTSNSGQRSGVKLDNTDITYQITDADAGAVIRIDMTAFDALGTVGNNANAETDLVIKPPTVSNVSIVTVSNSTYPWNIRVYGQYDFNEGVSASPGNDSTYSWTGITNQKIDQPTRGDGRVRVSDLVINQADAGKVLTFTVKARDFAGITGNTGTAKFNIPKRAVIPPTISIIEILNTNSARGNLILANDVLTADYEFMPGSESTIDASSFKWTGNGTNTKSGVIGADELTYTVLASDVGKVISLEMQAIDGAGVKGNIDTAQTFQAVSSSPKVTNVSINFVPEESTVVEGTYSYGAGVSTDNRDNSYYRWVIGGNAQTYSVVTTAQQVKGAQAYKVTQADVGKTIELEILPRDRSGLESTAVKSNKLIYTPLKLDSLTIEGNPVEDENLSAVATYSFGNNKTNKSTATWFIAGVPDQKSSIADSYLITSSAIGKIITLSATAIDGNGIEGNTLIADNSKGQVTGKYIPPYVAGVKINYSQGSQLVLPGHVLGGTYTVFDSGSVPGDTSLYSWLAGNSSRTSGTVSVSKTVPNYTVSSNDVGQVITLRVTARNGNKQEGNTAEDKTVKVSNSPFVDTPVITQNGVPVTNIYSNALLSGTYNYTNGRDGASDASIVTWYVNNISQQRSKITTSRIAPNFQLTDAYIGAIVKMEVTAEDTLGTPGGNTVSVTAQNAIQSSAPAISSVLVNADFTQNALVSGTYTFLAGQSTNKTDASLFEWVIDNIVVKSGSITNGTGVVSGANSYTVLTQDTGKTIRLRMTPKDASGQTGTAILSSNSVVYTAPKVSNLRGANTNTGIANNPINIEYDYTQGSNPKNNSVIQWSIKSVNNTVRTITSTSFTPVETDVGSVVSASVQAKDGNAITGNTITGVIIDPVKTAYIPPKVENVAIYYFTSRDLVMANQYLGGSYKFTDGSVPGDKSTYQWLSSTTVRQQGNVDANRSVPAYLIQDIDNGTVITLKITARDGNGNPGNTAQDQTGIVVAPPKVANPVITANGIAVDKVIINSQLAGRYDFTTGRPNATDASIVTWYVNTTEKQKSKIVTSGIATTFNITADYVGQFIKMEITAADSLGTPGGNTVSVTTSNQVASTAPVIETVTIAADFQTSAIVTGTYSYKGGASSNPLDASRYEWLANDIIMKSGTLPGTNRVDGVNAYTVQTQDTGKTLRLRLVPIDKSGAQGAAVYSTNSLVYTAPNVKINKIVGSGESNSALSVDYTYTAGSNKVNTSTIQWTLTSGQVNSFINSATFTPNDADIGKTISVSVTAKDGNQITGNTDKITNGLTVTEYWPTANFIQIMTASSAVVPTGQWVEYDYINPKVPENEPDTTLNYRVDFVDPKTGAVVQSRVFPVKPDQHDNAVAGSWQGGRDWYYGYEKYTVCVYVKTTDKAMNVIQKGKKCFAPPHKNGYRQN